jgi:hypothetical protein
VHNTHPSQTILSEDLKTFTVHGKSLSLPTFRAGIKQLFSDVEERIMKVMKGTIIPFTILDDIEDTLTNTHRDYSWLHNGKFTEHPNPLLKKYLEDPDEKLAYIGPDGHFHFDGGQSREIMEDMSFINQGLCMLSDTVNSQALRGTTLADLRISNGSRRRNHVRHHGQNRHILQYTKTSNSLQMDSYLPILVAPELQRLEDMYLVILRPMEETIAYALWGQSSRMLYREFMFVQMGVRLSETVLYRQFPVVFEKYMGVNLTLSEYRLWAIAAMREYIPLEYRPKDGQDTYGDNLCQHRTDLARRIYSHLEGDLPYLTTDFIWHCDQFCRCWHDLIGFGQNPPPLPLKLLSRSIQLLCAEASPTSLMEAFSSSPADANDSRHISSAVSDKMSAMENQIRILNATMESHLQTIKQDILKEMKSTLTQGLATLLESSHVVSGTPTIPSDQSLSFRSTQATSRPLPEIQSKASLPKTDNLAQQTILSDDEYALGDLYIQDMEDALAAEERRYEKQDDIIPSSRKRVRDEMEGDAKKDLEIETLTKRTRYDLEKRALETWRRATRRPDAEWKSKEQKETVLGALMMNNNMVSIMKTGGGKSMTWIIPSLMESSITVVLAPYKALLSQHLSNSKKMGCKAMQWTAKTGSIGDCNLIFVALETAASTSFKRLASFHMTSHFHLCKWSDLWRLTMLSDS